MIQQRLADSGEQSAAVPPRHQPPRHTGNSPIQGPDLLRAYAGWIPGVVAVKEVHGRIICANDHFFELIGRRDVVGQLPTEYFEHRTGELVKAHDDEVLKGQCPLLCVERVSVKDVPQRRIALRFPIRHNGRIELTGAVGFDEAFLNVAAGLNPKQSGKRTCRLPDSDAHAGFSDTFNSRALLEAFVESLPAVAAIKDLDGRLQYANAEYVRVTGKQLEDVIGQTTAKNWPGDPGQVIMAHDELVRETEESFLSVERVHGELLIP